MELFQLPAHVTQTSPERKQGGAAREQRPLMNEEILDCIIEEIFFKSVYTRLESLLLKNKLSKMINIKLYVGDVGSVI